MYKCLHQLLLFHFDWQSSALVDGALLHFCCL